ncbi:MAG: hypothetical protein ACI9LX_002097 [Paraglaciecola sp.]|jgi:hypothetical protein
MLITLATLGYGDIKPITSWRIFLVAALPAGILVSSFSEQTHKKKKFLSLKSSKL